MIYNQPRSTSFAVILLVLMMLPIGDGVQLVVVLMEMDRILGVRKIQGRGT